MRSGRLRPWFGHGHDEAQVGAGQLLERLLVALADALGEFDFLFGGHQFLAADLLQILVQGRALAVGDGFRNLKLSHISFSLCPLIRNNPA